MTLDLEIYDCLGVHVDFLFLFLFSHISSLSVPATLLCFLSVFRIIIWQLKSSVISSAVSGRISDVWIEQLFYSCVLT